MIRPGDTAYIIIEYRRFKGTIVLLESIHGVPITVGVLVPELDPKRPFERPVKEVYRTSREAKEAIQNLGTC